MQRCRVAQERGIELKPRSLAHDSHSVIANRAADQDAISGSNRLGAQIDRRSKATDSGRSDVAPVSPTALDDFGVPGHDTDRAFCGRLADRTGELGQLGDREPFLENPSRRQGHRLGTLDSQIIDRTVDRKFADIPAWEHQGLHDKRVGADGQAIFGRPIEYGTIALGREFWAWIIFCEHIVEELGRESTSSTMGHGDRLGGVICNGAGPIACAHRTRSSFGLGLSRWVSLLGVSGARA